MSNVPFLIAVLAIPVLAFLSEATAPASIQEDRAIPVEQSLSLEQQSVGDDREAAAYQILVNQNQRNASVVNFDIIDILSENDFISCRWNFGDGDVSTAKEVHHLYDVPGVYNVDLSITNIDGSEHSFSTMVTVPDMEPLRQHTASSSDLQQTQQML